MATKDEKLIFRCFELKENYEEDFSNELIKRFGNIYNFAMETLINLLCY